MRGLGLWGLTLLSTILQLYDGGQIYCWKNPVYPEKTPAAGHLQNLSHNVVSSKPRHERDSDSQVVINADCTDNWKSNYHTMKTTTVSFFMRSNWRHLPTIAPAIDDLVTGRLSPLIITPVVISKYIDCVKNHLMFF
jgi:hypothetical protein